MELLAVNLVYLLVHSPEGSHATRCHQLATRRPGEKHGPGVSAKTPEGICTDTSHADLGVGRIHHGEVHESMLQHLLI